MPGDRENQMPDSPQTASSFTQQSAVLLPYSGILTFHSFDPHQTQLTQVLDGENCFIGLQTYS